MPISSPSLFFNITGSISENSIVYAGDAPFSKTIISSCDHGDSCSLCTISMSNHLGTHIDFPAHFIPGGKTSSDFELSYFIGRALVIEIPDHISIISAEHIPDNLSDSDFVFFKTRNSDLTHYTEHYVAPNSSAALALKNKKIKIVGIDYLSIDLFNNQTFPVHQILLGAEILILENLNLKNVPAGVYQARIYPLQVQDIDGVPVTVSLEQ